MAVELLTFYAQSQSYRITHGRRGEENFTYLPWEDVDKPELLTLP